MNTASKSPFKFIPALFLLTLITGGAAPEKQGDLIISTGDSGALSTWMLLGPFHAPKGVLNRPGGLAGWNPAGELQSAKSIAPGTVARNARWSVYQSSKGRVRLKAKSPALGYLAVSLRTQEKRLLHLSTGSSGGLQVILNGRILTNRDVKKRSAAKDTEFTPLDLRAGENLLVVKIWKSAKRGAWLVYPTLLDETFRRPQGVEIALPEAADEAHRVSEKAGLVEIEREIDLETVTATARVWWLYPGGGPTNSTSHQLPYEMLLEKRFEKGHQVGSVSVTTPAGEKRVSLGLRMEDVEGLARAYADLEKGRGKLGIPRTSMESVEWRIDHLRALVEKGDRDWKYLTREIETTRNLAEKISKGEDPYYGMRAGLQRRGYRSSVDGKLHRYVLYVPPGFKEEKKKKYPLVVSLHGLNSMPMKSMTSLFGIPMREGEDKNERERHPPKVGQAPMFALAPEGFGNSGYRQFAERDVMDAIGRVQERYPIDPDRIYITGASMGGTGAAAIPLHYPGKFAAMAPLCGYHNLDVYRNLRGVKLRPWERFLKEFRSNDQWTDHGRHLPLYVVHGTKDGLHHSISLVENYRRRKQRVVFETPEAGHNVWDQTYAGKRIFSHFAKFKRPEKPDHVTVNTARLRYRENRWLRVDAPEDWASWTKVDAQKKDDLLKVTTSNAGAFSILAKDGIQPEGVSKIEIDGQELEPGNAKDGGWSFVNDDGSWRFGKVTCEGMCKKPGLAGPIDDSFYESLLFVYGTRNDEAGLGLRVADRIRKTRRGATVDWPVKADTEVTDDDIRNHSLVIIGTPQGNSLLARMADSLPLRVENGAVKTPAKSYEGDRVAFSLIYPNPLNPDRYVVVHTGVTPLAYSAAANLPQLLPDYLIYDGTDWGRSKGLVLNDREVLEGGFFDGRWRYQNP